MPRSSGALWRSCPTNLTDWNFVDNTCPAVGVPGGDTDTRCNSRGAGAPGTNDTNQTWPSEIYVRVYRVATSATNCEVYSLQFTR